VGRDPVEEKGGLNLYGFVANNAVNPWDFLGMFEFYYTDPDGSKSPVDFVNGAMEGRLVACA